MNETQKVISLAKDIILAHTDSNAKKYLTLYGDVIDFKNKILSFYLRSNRLLELSRASTPLEERKQWDIDTRSNKIVSLISSVFSINSICSNFNLPACENVIVLEEVPMVESFCEECNNPSSSTNLLGPCKKCGGDVNINRYRRVNDECSYKINIDVSNILTKEYDIKPISIKYLRVDSHYITWKVYIDGFSLEEKAESISYNVKEMVKLSEATNLPVTHEMQSAKSNNAKTREKCIKCGYTNLKGYDACCYCNTNILENIDYRTFTFVKLYF